MDLELKLYFTYNAEFLLRSTTLSFPMWSSPYGKMWAPLIFYLVTKNYVFI